MRDRWADSHPSTNQAQCCLTSVIKILLTKEFIMLSHRIKMLRYRRPPFVWWISVFIPHIRPTDTILAKKSLIFYPILGQNILGKGASVHDICSGWGPQKVDERNKISWFVAETRGEGIKKSENFPDVIYLKPLRWRDMNIRFQSNIRQLSIILCNY